MPEWGCANCGMLWGDEIPGPICPDCGALLIDEHVGGEVDTQECELTSEADPDGDGVSEDAEDDGLDQFDDGEHEDGEEMDSGGQDANEVW